MPGSISGHGNEYGHQRRRFGGIRSGLHPVAYRPSLEYVSDGLIDAESLLSHRHADLSELQQAFTVDSLRDDFIKGA